MELSATNSGGTGSATLTITIDETADTTPHELLLPGDQVAEATSAAGAVVTFTASAIDSGQPVPVTLTPPSGSTLPLGNTTVNASASDAAGNTTTGSFTVTVLSPAQQLQNLKTAINASTVLSAGMKNSLGAKLDSAANSLARGNANAAKGQLGAFVNEVEALVKSGRLTAAQAQPFLEAANRIRSQI